MFAQKVHSFVYHWQQLSGSQLRLRDTSALVASNELRWPMVTCISQQKSLDSHNGCALWDCFASKLLFIDGVRVYRLFFVCL